MLDICSQFFRVPNKRAILSQICSPLCTPNPSVRKKGPRGWKMEGQGGVVPFFPREIKLLVRYYFLLVWQILRRYWRGGYFPCLNFFQQGPDTDILELENWALLEMLLGDF